MHSNGRFYRNTLQHILNTVYHPQKPHPAHRLDANTTGLVLITRTRHFAGRLQPQFERGEVEKIYLVRASGQPAENEFSCTAPISGESGLLGSRAVDHKNGLDARTDFRVLKHNADGTMLLEARPLTGRTNQIRLHCAHLGFSRGGRPRVSRGWQARRHPDFARGRPATVPARVENFLHASTDEAADGLHRAAAGMGCLIIPAPSPPFQRAILDTTGAPALEISPPSIVIPAFAAPSTCKKTAAGLSNRVALIKTSCDSMNRSNRFRALVTLHAKAVHQGIADVVEDHCRSPVGLGDFKPHIVQRQSAHLPRIERIGRKNPGCIILADGLWNIADRRLFRRAAAREGHMHIVEVDILQPACADRVQADARKHFTRIVAALPFGLRQRERF